MKKRINRRRFIKSAGLSAAALAFPTLLGAKKSTSKLKPNIIIIFADDVGYGDIIFYDKSGLSTSNLKKMLNNGARFRNFYSASSVCSPSRAALLTGCYPQRVGIPKVLAPKGPKWTKGVDKIGINSEEQTIAEILKSQGYATACVGKWHLGHHAKFLPTRHGFDEYFGLPYSNDMRPENSNQWPALPLIEGEKVIENNPDQSQLTTRYTEKSIEFIKKNKDKPFFLYLSHSMPHVPLHVSDKFKGKTDRGLYGDALLEIDWSVGKIISTLKKLRIDKNTLVIFTSDNGPWLGYGNHGGSAWPLREGKGTTFEGGFRVPCIMYWPGKIPPHLVPMKFATTMDILPMVAKLAGVPLPTKKIDGKDIWKLVSGEPVAHELHEAFFYYDGWELQAVRSGNWKLHFPHKYRSLVKAGKDGKRGEYNHNAEIGLSLFDLKQDRSESQDVSAKHPDIVARLKALADKMREDIGDSAKMVKGKNRRPCGKL